MTRILLISIIVLVLSGCQSRFKHPDTSRCQRKVEIISFYQDLFSKQDASTDAKIIRLSEKYGDYFDAYCARELRIGHVGDEGFTESLDKFLGIKENFEVLATCDSVAAKSLKRESERLSDAVSCLAYYMPDITIPEHFYCHFSGFNNKIFVDSAYISISIEHYLGSDCRYYPWLEMPVYACKNKNPENMSIDLVKALIYANKPDLSEKDDVLSAMIYQAKVMYATAACFPKEKEWIIMGFTDDERKWCELAEKNMWGFMAEQKLLYSINPLDKNKLVNEAPFTVFFGDKSPGRAALYCGYNIVCSYMDNHKDATIAALFEMSDAQQFLIDAKYRP